MTTGKADVRAVRALAHPMRLDLLDVLRFEGPSTATLMAHRLGQSTGATSYHLRQLGRHGFIEEAPKRGRRERWWRYVERRVTVQPGGGTTNRDLLAELLSREAYALDRFLAKRSRAPEWDEAAFFQSRALRLTVAELDELRQNIETLLAPLRRGDAEGAGPSGTLPVRVLAFGFPQSMEEP